MLQVVLQTDSASYPVSSGYLLAAWPAEALGSVDSHYTVGSGSFQPPVQASLSEKTPGSFTVLFCPSSCSPSRKRYQEERARHPSPPSMCNSLPLGLSRTRPGNMARLSPHTNIINLCSRTLGSFRMDGSATEIFGPARVPSGSTLGPCRPCPCSSGGPCLCRLHQANKAQPWYASSLKLLWLAQKQ